ncbi:P-loop NTPase fold protein [Streptomyces sp. NBC_01198]|uniref:P-loop NTPase fold protein n=1 Tax=Streptomyces sp. NBC_01198 TaxID=2903769 RepID=UPI002E0D8C3D|nr:KAP family NTPase [Streptomyces sp. NBC_01198]
MSEAAADSRGGRGRVRVSVAVTEEPWGLDVDAIVVSVGGGFGQLAAVVAGYYPEAPFGSVDLTELTPSRPGLVRLREPGTRGRGPWLAVLATPHDEQNGSLNVDSLTTATRAALRAAADMGALAVALPLLATGALGLEKSVVAAVLVPAATDMAAGLPLQHLVLLTNDEADVPILRAAQVGELPAPRTPWLDGRRPAQAALVGGMSTDRVDPNTGIPLTEDRLGAAPYVSMLAAVISDRKTPTPLSVGIFGEWGSGKSYFMGLLRSRVAELAASGNPGYCQEVTQIGFNAWHYADTNIWASLGDEIFRQLAGPGPSTEDLRRQLRTELAQRMHQRREYDAVRRQARSAAAELQADVDAAAADRQFRVRALVDALKGSPAFAQQVQSLWRKLGVTSDVEQARLLADELQGTLSEAEALRRAPRDRAGRAAVAAAALALLLLLVVGAFAPGVRAWLAPGGGVLAAAAGLGLTMLTRARSGIRALRSLSDDLRAGLDRSATGDAEPAVADALHALRQAEADRRVAEAQLDDVMAHIGGLGRRLTELSPGRRLYSFLSERAGGDSYTGNLGLISVLRKDLEQLVELMADWRAHPEQERAGHRPIDRIVLYIDDLDRCSSRQVVEVLQAVHLLLALDLFVVVIGVDPRWLVRSLSSHYGELLDTGVPPAPDEPDRRPVTPEDYLDKIINIPVLLPGMPARGLRSLLSSLADVGDRAAPAAGPAYGGPGGSADFSMTIEAGSEADRAPGATRSTPFPLPPRPLTEPELAVLSGLDLLIDTPRKAKRLLNLYRMLRATRDLSSASRFLGEDGSPGEYQAVAVLLGLVIAEPGLLPQLLDTPPDPTGSVPGGLMHRLPDTSWPDFVASLEVRDFANGVAGDVGLRNAAAWARLHAGVLRASAEVTLPDLKSFRLWAPRIRRFSYVLARPDVQDPQR